MKTLFKSPIPYLESRSGRVDVTLSILFSYLFGFYGALTYYAITFVSGFDSLTGGANGF